MSKILFIGGNGNISWYCVNEAQAAGHEVWLMHRGESVATRRAIQEGVRVIRCDARDRARAESALQGMHFDVVCDFICYNKSHAALDVELFYGRTQQFIFISSVVVYRRATQYLPFTEETPMWDVKWTPDLRQKFKMSSNPGNPENDRNQETQNPHAGVQS